MRNYMKINEFCQALQERVEDFQKYWKKCQKDYPHFYPDELEDAMVRAVPDFSGA